MPRQRWANWMRNQTCECEVVTPRSLAELRDAVRAATRAGRRVRATGRGYSWSPLVPNEGTIVRMHELGKVLHFDEQSSTIEVECGMTIQALDRFVRRRGLTLVSPTLFPKPTVGGVVATGSHGTGFGAGNFSDQILEMTIVRADGEVRKVGCDHPDYRAAAVALGTLGVVYSVKLKLLPQFNVYVDKRYVPVHYVLEEFDDLRRSCEYLEMLWFPFQGKMWLYIMNRTNSLPDRPRLLARVESRLRGWAERWAAYRGLPWIARHAPRLTPLVNGIASRFANEVTASVQTASDAFHFLKTYPRNWDLAYAVPDEQAGRAWSEAIGIVHEYARADLYPVNLALHCRFIGPSTAWLAPNYARRTCHIEVATLGGTPNWQPFFAEMEERWAAIEGARPHWAKLYGGGRLYPTGQLYGPWRDVAARYARMGDFLAVRERWDPERVFLNSFLEQDVFTLPARVPAAPPPAARRPTPTPTPPPRPSPDPGRAP